MIELFEQDITTIDRQSSKGNQLKWKNGDVWYKADYSGYEGLTEYVISKLLKKSTLKSEWLVDYDTEEIIYKNNNYCGCKSNNFLEDGWEIVTLERLFMNFYGKSLYKSIYNIEDEKERVLFLVNQVQRITGLEFGEYLTFMLSIDTFFMNEDRHTHNIAVLKKSNQFKYCPIYDNGAALLSDIKMDYPLGVDIHSLITEVESKTFCSDFDQQIDIIEEVFGKKLYFEFTDKDIMKILSDEKIYSQEIKNRILLIVLERKRKFQYMFKK